MSQLYRIAVILALNVLFVGCTASTTDEIGDKPEAGLDSPVESFFELSGGSDSALRRWQIESQETTARCMANEGFDFVVSVPPESIAIKDQASLSDQDWTSEYGYGISTSVDYLLSIQLEDPNAQHLTTLAPEEQQRYLTALVGEKMASGQVLDPSQIPPLEEQGCTGEGVLATGGQAITEDLTEFNIAYQDAQVRVMSEPEVQSAIENWSTCLAELGYNYNDPSSPRAYIASRTQVIIQPVQQTAEDLSSDELESIVSGTGDADLTKLPGFDPEALAELQDEERAIASADYECYEEHVAAIYEPLLYGREEQLIDEYGDALNAARELVSE